MTTSISIKKVLVGVAATALLISPLFAMADDAALSELSNQLDAVGTDANGNNKFGSGSKPANALIAAKTAINNARKHLRSKPPRCVDAARELRKAAAALKKVTDWNASDGSGAANQAAVNAAVNALEAAAVNAEQQCLEATPPTSGLPPLPKVPLGGYIPSGGTVPPRAPGSDNDSDGQHRFVQIKFWSRNSNDYGSLRDVAQRGEFYIIITASGYARADYTFRAGGQILATEQGEGCRGAGRDTECSALVDAQHAASIAAALREKIVEIIVTTPGNETTICARVVGGGNPQPCDGGNGGGAKLDFGDAPTNIFPTSSRDNGIRHPPGGPVFGEGKTEEGDALQDNDDQDDAPPTRTSRGGVQVFVSSPIKNQRAFLNFAVDLNSNGRIDPNEWRVRNQPVTFVRAEVLQPVVLRGLLYSLLPRKWVRETITPDIIDGYDGTGLQLKGGETEDHRIEKSPAGAPGGGKGWRAPGGGKGGSGGSGGGGGKGGSGGSGGGGGKGGSGGSGGGKGASQSSADSFLGSLLKVFGR